MLDAMNRAIYKNIKGIKILHLIQRLVKFYPLHLTLTIRVLYQ